MMREGKQRQAKAKAKAKAKTKTKAKAKAKTNAGILRLAQNDGVSFHGLWVMGYGLWVWGAWGVSVGFGWWR
jgi:hypothetical protein